MANTRLFRDCLQDANLAPTMDPALWEQLAELSKRHRSILGLLAFIMDMCREDEQAMAQTQIIDDTGRIKLAQLQGMHLAKRHVVARVCDLMGDLAASGEEVESEIDSVDMEQTPSWAYPDDHEDEERKAKRSRPARPRPRPRPRVEPIRPARKVSRKKGTRK